MKIYLGFVEVSEVDTAQLICMGTDKDMITKTTNLIGELNSDHNGKYGVVETELTEIMDIDTICRELFYNKH